MKFCIILNGEIQDYQITSNIIKENNYDFIICADGGANHAYNMNIVPNYIIGDLDSIDSVVKKYFENQHVEFKKFPEKKDETDTELCIYLANELGATHIDFYGALGGRIDHMIANINLLYYTRSMGLTVRIMTCKEEMYIAINEELVIEGLIGDTVSVIPIYKDAKGVTLKGFEWALYNHTMEYGKPLGISNIMIEKICSIRVDEGSLLVVRNK